MVYVDLSKSQIIEVLDSLESQADRFEKRNSSNGLLTVAIINVGFYLDMYFNKHFDMAIDLGYTKPE